MAKSKSVYAEKSLQNLGSWAFLLGVFVAIVTSVVTPATIDSNGDGIADMKEPNPTVVSFLVLLGTIVGLLNVTTKEINSFLLASVSLVVVAWLGGSVIGGVVKIGEQLSMMLDSMLVFVVPATIVVSLKSIFSLAQSK